jgi:carbonic anhydrase
MNALPALKKLAAGNKRYVAERYAKINIGFGRRFELSEGQHPFAIILGCSDSRIPPEIIFDQGLGDLFVIRTAGQVVDDVVLGSIEYAVEHFGVRLIVVLGHEGCGAIKAALQDEYIPCHISTITNKIKPAVEKAKTQIGDLLINAIIANIELNVYKLETLSPILHEALMNKGLLIIGAIYDMQGGNVSFEHYHSKQLEPHDR